MKNEEHTIVLITSGMLELSDLKGTTRFQSGDLCFCSGKSLIKQRSYPDPSGEYQEISIALPQTILKTFAHEFNHAEQHSTTERAFSKLTECPLLLNYMRSLLPYQAIFKQENSKELLIVKVKEAIITLLMEKPEMKQVLFDFSNPPKIELEPFMLQHYHFNVELKRFAYFSGRSLSTFKRDFERTFQTAPSRWLMQKRLEQAYYLIKKKRRSASAVYLEVGFEDLSHFSYVFKKYFGVPPSLL
jgi:AraC-like DNA-binding protein